MIYIGKPISSTLIEEKAKDLMQFFLEYEPSYFEVSKDPLTQKELKTKKVECFISGEFKELVRNDENLLSRDALVIDIDHTELGELELIQTINQRIGKLNYVLYPSLNNGIKGVRYRLVVPLDQSIGKEDYKLLVKYFSLVILNGILSKVDESNFSFSQLQALPVLTHENDKDKIIISLTEFNFPVEKGLAAASEEFKNEIKPFKKDYRPVSKTKAASFIDMIFGGVEEGSRDNSLTKLAGWLLWHGVDNETLVQAMHVANVNSNPPLDEKDVNKIIRSMIKKDVRGRGIR